MSSNLPAPTAGADIMEAVITRGDLAKLSPQERSEYYGAVCKSIGLNPLTKPFDYLTLSGKLVLYATRTATDQLRRINGVSITSVERDLLDGVLMITATAQDRSGRVDTEIGAVTVAGLKGDALANAYMKALTKAKRRVTLSICGLGWLDESEVETIPLARTAAVDHETGEIVDASQTRQIAPGRTEAPSPWTTLVRAAAYRQISEESLREYFAARGVVGVNGEPVGIEPVQKLTAWIETHTLRQIQDHFRDVISQRNRPPKSEVVDTGDDPGMDDDDYAQVVASIDAEQAPDRAALAAHYTS